MSKDREKREMTDSIIMLQLTKIDHLIKHVS